MDAAGDMEATSLPFSLTTDWLEDGNETVVNQFQQPDWQVENKHQRSIFTPHNTRFYRLGTSYSDQERSPWQQSSTVQSIKPFADASLVFKGLNRFMM